MARRTLGFWDFLFDVHALPAAGGGTLDLTEDEREATQLMESPNQTYAELTAALTRIRGGEAGAGRGAIARFNARYEHVHEEVGLRHGDAILQKINLELGELGTPPVAGRWALEGGGGHGLYVPGFRRVFEHVAFVDCSLVNLVLASRIAKEAGVGSAFFVRADVTRLPFAFHAFDFVHENGVVEHVHDPMSMISEAIRVTRQSGTYACISPNRFSIAPEAHFRLPLFGAWPRFLRKPAITRVRGLTSEAGTDLRSLRQLRSYFSAAGAGAHIFFLPRRLGTTARSSRVRQAIRLALGMRGIGRLAAWTMNRVFLGVMPYHIALVTPGATSRETGAVERVEDPNSPWWAEHRSRYRFASQLVRGETILDVACGSIGGLAVLDSDRSRVAVGVDNSLDAIERSRAAKSNAVFVSADALALPFQNAAFTTVVSFETLEHVKDADAFADELERILSDDGVLVLSTPNAAITKPGTPRNPFHVREATPDELGGILRQRFEDVRILGQTVAPGFGVCPFWETSNAGGERRARKLVWKLLSRMPASVRDRLSRSLLRQPLFPGEGDFAFSEHSVRDAHVLVAVCRQPRHDRSA